MSFFHRLPGAKAAAARYRPVAALLLGATFLFLGQGVFLILVPLKLAADGLTAIEISAVGAAYFAGVVSGAWFGDRITRAVGNIRAYAGSVALIICAALALSLVGSAAGWAALRFMHGWAAAGVFLAIESWLHGATPNEWRGRVVGAYTALTLVGLGGGQLLINVYGPAAPSSVDLGALLFAFSIVPVVLSKASAPAQRTMAPRSPLAIYRHSPLAVAGCVCAGLSMGAFWALGPVFADETASRAASPFMAAAIMGGLSLVLPFGRLSDRIDRRLVIAGLSAGGGAAALLVVI
jgi:MFS family permease